MALITADELARGAILVVFGGSAGALAMVAPGTLWWTAPAAVGLACGAVTVPEVRGEMHRALPMVAQARAALPGALWALPGISPRSKATGESRLAAQERVCDTSPAAERPELLVTLDEQPHRLIIGHTRGGKTTLIHELATDWARRGERVLVGDPDAAPGLWPGCEVRGYGDDVQGIGELLGVVAAEVEARRLARAQGVRRFEPLHLVIDEAQDVLPVLDGGLELFEDVARRGGKLNVRLTVGVQDKQVKTLGLEGKSALLRNFQVAEVLKNREGRRVAQLRDAETGQKVSLPIPELPDPERLIITRPATETTQNLHPRQAAPADDQAVLASLLAAQAAVPAISPERAERLARILQSQPAPAQSVSTAVESQGHGAGVSVSVTNAGTQDTGHAPVTIHVNATAEAGHAPRKGVRGRGGLNMRRRRQRAVQARQDTRKGALAAAYAEKKAAGWSYRKAYAELGGNSDEARAAWRAAPEPTKE